MAAIKVENAILNCQLIKVPYSTVIKGKDVYDNGECKVSPQSLCVLLRRLGDTEFKRSKKHSAEEIWDAASSLQSSILMVLGIDDYGHFVGREAMGLE